MEQRPSLILPKKRFRCKPGRPNVTVKITSQNIVKKLTESEVSLLETYISIHPGEYYKPDYWVTALSSGLAIDSSAESLRLWWLHNQTLHNLNSRFSINISNEPLRSSQILNKTEPELPEIKILICKNNIQRKVYDLKRVEESIEEKKVVENFKMVVEKCRKISKQDISEKQVLEWLIMWKGNTKDMINDLIRKGS